MTAVDETRALLVATQALMQPLARLLVARGVLHAQAEECLKAAMVDAARQVHPDGLPHRMVSRIATTTGINRREVTRLTRSQSEPSEPQRSVAAEIFTRWSTAPGYCDAHGRPRTLARQGDAPSFESLARSVTQDVHPRSLLDELLRLGLASHDATSDTVTLVVDGFVPSADRVRMLEFLAHNVGDHLSAAVANVLGPAPRHLERAVFADGMSPAAIASAEAWMAEAWRDLLARLVPFLEKLIEAGAHEPASARQERFRAGLYAYTASEAGAVAKPELPDQESTAAPKPARRQRATRGEAPAAPTVKKVPGARKPRTR